ncbi:MAG: hypothetical protein LBC74_10655 [Planctomycetaceae bacterium]|nr:hypothetical protein [Planctomycetaceae bacterium]
MTPTRPPLTPPMEGNIRLQRRRLLRLTRRRLLIRLSRRRLLIPLLRRG